jgi:hypothetical protein
MMRCHHDSLAATGVISSAILVILAPSDVLSCFCCIPVLIWCEETILSEGLSYQGRVHVIPWME